MIFVTVGSMLPFDRLIEAMDQWANTHPDHELVAQIGNGTYHPKRMSWRAMYDSQQFKDLLARSQLVVAHAGMGSIITALQVPRPIVILPRQMAYGEHTTEHQLHTAQRMKVLAGVYLANDVKDLDFAISQALQETQSERQAISAFAPSQITETLKELIQKELCPR